MRFLAYFFFYTYVGLMIVAGVWGAFPGGRIDQQLLFNLDPETLPEQTAASMLSQYRFLRLIEAGFGLFAVLFTREIFSLPRYNYLFLGVMFLGVLARTVSCLVDGSPHWLFYFFAIYEFVGVVLIYLYSRKTVTAYENAS